MGRLRRTRWRARTSVLLGLGLAGGVLTACGQGANAEGHQACVEVAASIRLYNRSQHTSGSAAANDRARALTELRQALRPAAQAGSADGDWQALEATLAESSRVPESDLVTALQAQCAATLQSGS